ncbi:MAG: right-handed parallel beta-helix repeat-containing protein, partial [Thermoguttaceae bacterium]|nr:right-handed parallel beta-helix repeat-containing protein [Thermoguttaceae bacterium]
DPSASTDTILYSTDGVTYDLTENPAYTNAGTYTTYVKVSRENYNDWTSSAAVTITPATITGVTFADATVTYDAQARTITVGGTIDGDTVYYSADGETWSEETPVTYTNAGTYTLYAKVSRDNYNDWTGSAVLTINPAPLTLSFTAQNKVYDGTKTATATLSSATGLVGGETMTLRNIKAEFESAEVGVHHVAITSYSTRGTANKANYAITETVNDAEIIAPETPSMHVTTCEDVVDNMDNKISLREALTVYYGTIETDPVTYVNDGHTVTFDDSLIDSATGLAVMQTGSAFNLGGKTYNYDGLVIQGNTKDSVNHIVFANQSHRIFNVSKAADITFNNLIFNANDAGSQDGAVIRVSAESATKTVTVNDSEFTNNSTGGNGGAIYVEGMGLTVNGCTFTGNSSESTSQGDGGGAIYAAYGATLTVKNSRILQNTSANCGGGICVYAEGSDVTFEIYQSLIADNVAAQWGCGVYVGADTELSATGTISWSTLTGNNDGNGWYQDLHLNSESSIDVQGSIVSDFYIGGTATFANSLYKTPGGQYTPTNCRTYSSGDILFADAEHGDYTLAADSVAIDFTGVTSGGPAADLAGNTRPIGAAYDAGAYEYQEVTPPTPPTQSVIVNTAGEDDNPDDNILSLREALEKCANGDVKTITFADTDVKTDLALTTLSPDHGFLLLGPQYNGITIDGGGDILFDGNSFTIFTLSYVEDFAFKGLTFQNLNQGSTSSAIFATGSTGSSGLITVDSCQFLNNSANGSAIGTQNLNLNVTDSTFSGNSSTQPGGAISCENSENVEIKNSIFRGNNSGQEGGAIYGTGSNLTIVQSLIVDNAGDTSGGVYVADGRVNVSWSTLANNSNKDIAYDSSSATVSNSIALELRNSSSSPVSKTYVITSSEASAADLFVDAAHGDYTLKAGSEAINYTDVTSGDPVTDLAGNTRAGHGSAYDCGAYEYISSDPPTPPVESIVVTTADDVVDSGDGLTSLSEALTMCAGGDIKTITFADGITTLSLNSGFLLDSTHNGITIDGGGDVVFDGNNFQIFNLASVDDFTFKGLTFQNLNSGLSGAGGSAISAEGSTGLTVTVDSCRFLNNRANGLGGAIRIRNQNLKVTDSTFSGNISTQNGGAIYCENSGNVEIKNSIFRGNHGDAEGGAIYGQNSNLTIVQSLIVDNTSDAYGGGVYIDYGNANISWSTLANNSDSEIVADIALSNLVTVSNSIALKLSLPETVTKTHVITSSEASAADLFTNVAGGDYTLKAGSAAINASVDVTSGDPVTDLAGNTRAGHGSAYDCGAYEYVGASPASLPYSDAADAAFDSLDEDDLKVDFDVF